MKTLKNNENFKYIVSILIVAAIIIILLIFAPHPTEVSATNNNNPGTIKISPDEVSNGEIGVVDLGY